MSTMKEKMHTGELYLPGDGEITEKQIKCLDMLCNFNMTRPTEPAGGMRRLRQSRNAVYSASI